MKKYCLTKSTQSENKRWQIVNDWYWHSKWKQIPYIRLKQRARRTDIHWDYITYPISMDDAFDGENRERLRREILDMFSRMAEETRDPRITCMASGWTADFHNVPNGVVEGFAKELFDMIVRHCRDFLAARAKEIETLPGISSH